MRVIFLDIDGVLNGHDFDAVAKSCTLRRECVLELNRIIKVTGAKIVLSSAWRYMIFGGTITSAGFAYMLRTHGVCEEIEIVGTTPADEQVVDRADQIANWLRDHPEVIGYVVIDDLELPIERFVRTESAVGLTAKNADDAIKIITG